MMNQILMNKYDADALAFRVTYQNEKLRESEAYENEVDRLIDVTMSCNRREAILWLVKFMEDAIKYGIETRDLGWKTRFLAAYDICSDL